MRPHPLRPGESDCAFCRRFGIDFGYDAAVLSCRRTLPIGARIAMHAGPRGHIRRARDLLHEPRNRGWWEATVTAGTVEEPK